MTIASGPVIQVCWVVEDIEAAETFHSQHFGVGAWFRLPDIRFGPDEVTLHGDPADFTVHVSMAYAGDLQLELIQPVSGESIYTEHLARSGPGLHHICFETDDLDAAVDRARAAGLDVPQQGVMGGGLMSFAYVDGARWGVPYVELAQLSDGIRDLYAAIKDPR
ncbi:VOC family protein [Nocardioides sp. MH1]|uniref:VOC family protein n=1 Tax=Nocardioides sp. MH1 TaxID=3242490 RepID=UPI00351FACA9